MAKGGYRPGAGRPKGSKTRAAAEGGSEGGPKENKTPLEYMLDVMNDPTVEKSRRDRMAIAAAPFKHRRVGDSGKKDEKSKAAESAGKGRFSPAPPPLALVKKT